MTATLQVKARFCVAAAAAALILLFGVGARPAVAADDAVESADRPTHSTAARESAADPEHNMAVGTEHGAAGTAGGHREEPTSLLRPINAGLVTSITTFIVFLALVYVLTRYAWGPIASGLKAREDKIRKDIADAEAARARAEATLRDYNTRLSGAEQQIREMLAKATADGEKIANNIRMDAQREAQESKERAQKDIEVARDQAINQLREEAVVLATNIAEKIVRRNLNPNDQRDLLASSLDQLQTVGSR